MKLKTFEIRRFRSFDTKVELPLSDLTVLLGPNNLGKSTVLNALSVFFGSFQRTYFGSRFDQALKYSQDVDYPKKYAGQPGHNWPTLLKATFR